ncbi:flagellar basal body protein [Phycisphaeraceae bacterium D3-23]
MFGALDTSTSGLVAQRTRADVITANLANANTVQDADGKNNPFRRRLAVLAPGDPTTGNPNGVHVHEIAMDMRPFNEKLAPGHHLAGQTASRPDHIQTPNIDPMTEQVNMLETARAYEANIAAAEATKTMMQTSLRLIA